MKMRVRSVKVTMRHKLFLAMAFLSILALGVPRTGLYAEEVSSEGSLAAAEKDWKAEIGSDRAALKAEKEQMKTNASAARAEEKALKGQIKQAQRSGDTATAESLKAQLKTMHQENVDQKQQDKKELKAARQELRSDKKEARVDRMDANNDGTADKTERAKYREEHGRRDKDNNPPGRAGGPGTNWENKPGPQGGPGASPDRRGRGRDGDRGRGEGGNRGNMHRR